MRAAEKMRQDAVDCFHAVGTGGGFLDRLQWPRSVERKFFARRGGALPVPSYEVDRQQASANVRELTALQKRLKGAGALPRLLRRTTESYLAAHRMLLAIGTARFYQLSREQYGGATTMALDADSSNLDLALHIGRRIGEGKSVAGEEKAALYDDAGFVRALGDVLRREHPTMEVEIVVDPDMSAKVTAGAKRVRVRQGATFAPMELQSLYLHEIETHVLTGQNGKQQQKLPFLKSGGPRTTRTQEGIAVFSELYGHALSIHRLRRLVERVRLVAMAEDGASFLDVYRHLVELGFDKHDAYLDAMRIFRGGVPAGGAPFTKDACYLSGLAEVYNFLRICLHQGAHRLAEVMVSGRMSLDDLDELYELSEDGTLERPAHVPSWLRNWDALVPYFGFTSFLNEIDLPPLERRFAAVRRLVRGARE